MIMSHSINRLSLPAPAKLNLFLHINGRRPDGYHELQTLFQFIDQHDELDFSLTEDDRISIHPDIPGVSCQDNLIYRAAEKLLPYRHTHQGVEITLNKKLPMGGGLGGGSSDAATTLIALNILWRCNLNTDRLTEIGLSLGADVPIFIRGHAAFAEGVGEQLTEASPTEYWYVVLTPACHVNTGEIFSHQGLTRDTPKIKIAPALEGDAKHYRNDCEAIVRELYLPVKEALNELNKFGNARLTGTGACVFAGFDSEEKANHALSNMPSRIEGFIAKGLNVSPVIDSLTQQLHTKPTNHHN